jgi:hypothetical protein
MDLFISSADELVLANLASLAVQSQTLHLTLTYVNHSGFSINLLKPTGNVMHQQA